MVSARNHRQKRGEYFPEEGREREKEREKHEDLQCQQRRERNQRGP